MNRDTWIKEHYPDVRTKPVPDYVRLAYLEAMVAELSERLEVLEKLPKVAMMSDGRLVIGNDFIRGVSHGYTVKDESTTDETTDFELIAPDVFPPSSPAERASLYRGDRVCTCEQHTGEGWFCDVCGGGRF